MGDVRRGLHHRWFPYLAGALAGLIIASTCSAYWQRTANQPAIILMGTGHGLSALITTAAARILVVGGDDPIALANAFADGLPPTLRRIDVVVITPGASTIVTERAVALSGAQRVMAIDATEETSDEPGFDGPVRMIGGPRTIELGGELLVDINPGLIAGQPASGWSIRVQSESASVVLAESVPFRPAPGVGLVAVMGATVPPAVQSLNVPVVFASDSSDPTDVPFGTIAPGETRRIPIGPDAITLPADWTGTPDK
jgi:hypothetical protein